MKTLALMLILGLHTTGIWPHLSETSRTRLVSKASDTPNLTQPAPQPSPARLQSLPIRASTAPVTLDAASAMALDTTTGTVLYAKNPAARRPIASITKIAAALVLLSRHSPNETVTIPPLPTYPSDAAVLGLVPGDTFRFSELLEAALVPSANDAADALAIWDAGSVAKFTAKMNAKMTEWDIADARFSNVSGLQDSNNYASAAALAKIASLAMRNTTFARTVEHQAGTITSGQGRVYNFTTTNKLLASGQFYGIKTGYTLAAGECFVGLTRVNGHEVITVVLGSSDRFGTTTTLTNWIGRTWQWL